MGLCSALQKEMGADATFEGWRDNSSELKYRDASCQKRGQHRLTERRGPGLRGRYSVASKIMLRSWSVPVKEMQNSANGKVVCGFSAEIANGVSKVEIVKQDSTSYHRG